MTFLIHRLPRAVALSAPWLVPALLALTGLFSAKLGWDRALADWFYDPLQGGFPARGSLWLELIGHRGVRWVLEAGWWILLVAAVLSGRFRPFAPHRRVLWATAIAMALGPLLVSLLKSLTAPVCPWDLQSYGGLRIEPAAFWAWGNTAGHCFPSGHAAAGFSLIALYWAGRATGRPGLQTGGLVLAGAVGTLLSLLRMAQGAHFLSHNLWAAAIDWVAALGVFWAARLPVLPSRTPHHVDTLP